MARPRKVGLDYYPADTNRRNDFKIMDLLNEYGPLGYTIYDFCLQYIYQNGYYLDVPLQQVALTLTRDIGGKWIKNKDLVRQIIDYCAEIGLFDQDLLQRNILTSVGIQRRYNTVTVRNKVDKSKYWLLEIQKSQEAKVSASNTPVSATETPIIATETPVSVTKMQQSKENKRKEKKNKCLNVQTVAEATAEQEEHIVFIKLILNDKTYYDVTETEVNEYTELYPSVDVKQEFRNMAGWCNANKTKRKTRKGIKRFINGWLAREQNKGGSNYGTYQNKHLNQVACQVKTAEYNGGQTI